MLGDLIPLIEVQNPRLVNGVPMAARAACIHIMPPVPAEFGEGEANTLKIVWKVKYYKKVMVDGVETVVYADTSEAAPYYVTTRADDTTPVDQYGRPLLKLENGRWVSDWEHEDVIIVGYDETTQQPIKLGQLTGLRMATPKTDVSPVEQLAGQIINDINYQDVNFNRLAKAD